MNLRSFSIRNKENVIISVWKWYVEDLSSGAVPHEVQGCECPLRYSGKKIGDFGYFHVYELLK